MSSTILSSKRLWQLAAASLLFMPLLLMVKRPDPPLLTQDAMNKRIAFCASVIHAVKPGDKTCGPYMTQARQLLAQQKQAAAAAEEASKPKPFDPNGWFQTPITGIYMRYCSPTDCSRSKAIEGYRALMVEIWCKTRACGRIYGEINLKSSDGTVVGWTNDTATGNLGDKVQLTMQSSQDWSGFDWNELTIGGVKVL